MLQEFRDVKSFDDDRNTRLLHARKKERRKKERKKPLYLLALTACSDYVKAHDTICIEKETICVFFRCFKFFLLNFSCNIFSSSSSGLVKSAGYSGVQKNTKSLEARDLSGVSEISFWPNLKVLLVPGCI